MARSEKPKRKATAAQTRNRGPGQPTAFRSEYCDIAKRLAEQGATDQEMADVLRVHRATFYRWLAEHQDFRDAVKMGKDPADDRVERAFYSRCVGYEYEAVKIMQNNGIPVVVPYREHVPPDPGAAMNWLKNRRGEKWKDTKALTGADGGPIALTSVIEFVDAPPEPGTVSS